MKNVMKALVAAVKDINKNIKLDPPLNEKGDEASLTKDLVEIAGDIKATDKLADLTRETIKALVPAKAEKPVKETKAAKKESKVKGPKVPRDKSNKAIMYKAWKAGTKDSDKLLKVVKGAVKETTVRSWLNSWKNGKNLPAIAG